MTCSETPSNDRKKEKSYPSIMDINLKKEILDNISKKFIIRWDSNHVDHERGRTWHTNVYLAKRLIGRFYPNAIHKMCRPILNKYYIDPGIYIVPLDGVTVCRITVDLDSHDKDTASLQFELIGLNINMWNKRVGRYFLRASKELDKLMSSTEGVLVCNSVNDLTKEISVKSIDEYYFDDKERIIDAINDWRTCRSIYDSFNQRYRFTILLYGVPGTGKTTFTYAIAKMLNMVVHTHSYINEFCKDICYYNHSEELFLLDEIDVMIKDANSTMMSKSSNGESFTSGELSMLKAMDIVSDGNVVVCTTNHIEDIPEPLLRPGRFDIVMEVKPASRKMAEEMLNRYNLPHSILDEIGEYKDTCRYQQAAIEQAIIREKIKEKLSKKEN